MSANKVKKTNSGGGIPTKRKDIPPPLPSTPPPPLTNSLNDEVCHTECPFTSEQHEGREFAQVSLSLQPKEAFRLIFEEETLIAQIYNDKNYVDVVFSSWTPNETGDLLRTLTYTAHLPSKALGPSFSEISEIQTRSSLNQENELYVINCIITNSGIPYGDSFKIYIHYCIIKEKSLQASIPQCRFSYYANVKFKKAPIFFIKGLIERSAYEGLQSICEDLVHCLTNEAEKANGMVKQPRRKRPTNDVGGILAKKRKEEKKGSENNSSKLRTCSAMLVFLLLISIAVLNGYLYLQLKEIERVTNFKQNLLLEQSTGSNLKIEATESALEEYMKNFMIKRSLLEENFKEWKMKLDGVFLSLNSSIVEVGELLEVLPTYMMKFKSLSLELESGTWTAEENELQEISLREEINTLGSSVNNIED